MKRNVTITLDVETARWARIEAARHDVSVSQFLGDLLRERMRREEGYAAAMARYRAGRPTRLKSGQGYPSRQELHERTHVR
jgi:plasmid stability protein